MLTVSPTNTNRVSLMTDFHAGVFRGVVKEDKTLLKEATLMVVLLSSNYFFNN